MRDACFHVSEAWWEASRRHRNSNATKLSFPLMLVKPWYLTKTQRLQERWALTLGAWSFALPCLTPLRQNTSKTVQGAKRRAAGAVSGEAAERPMEPETFRAHNCVFAVPIFPGHCCFLDKVSFYLSRIMV